MYTEKSSSWKEFRFLSIFYRNLAGKKTSRITPPASLPLIFPGDTKTDSSKPYALLSPLQTMILDQVKRTIEKYRMLSKGDRLIVGVSGGMDSVALLSVLEKLREAFSLSLVVAHLNHNLRGEESDRDAAFVQKLALKFGLPAEIETVAVRELRAKGMTLQEIAREVRFDFFHRLVRKHNAQRIALGQTADDQAETIVMRFIRGSGLMGLKGIPPVRDELIIHPLMEVERETIEGYLADEGLPHVEDSSNSKGVYLRNRIRRHLIPLLEEYNPNLKRILGRMGQVLLQEDLYVRGRTQEVWDRIARQEDNVVNLDLAEFADLHPAIQFRLLVQSVGAVSETGAKRLGVAHILSLANLATGEKPHGVINLPGRIAGRRTYNRLEIGEVEALSCPDFDHELASPGTTPIRELGKKLVIDFVDQWNWRDASPFSVFMDSHRLPPPLRVRNCRRGDRFRPLGMTGRKKVKDCFIDWKIPIEERARVPLVLSGDEIVWVVGYRISQDVRVTGETERVTHMELQDL